MKRVGVLAALLAAAATASAGPTLSRVTGMPYQLNPAIVAGAPPDSPSNRIDPNVDTSAFTGVVSINIRFDGLSFICSGAAISRYTIVTAAHCIDTTDNGTPIDLGVAGNDVRVVVNNNPVFNPATNLITARSVAMHPNYQGFGICPDGSFGCVNDDLAIITLSQPLPEGVQIYNIHSGPVATNTEFTMVGYGTSGNGLTGYDTGPDFFVKRVGANIYDIFDNDDEADFDPNSAREVWYYDFDGTRGGVNRDTFCLLGWACSQQLANDIETHLGGGDSGGPSFVLNALGEYELVANNTFGINFCYGDDPRDQNGNCTSGDFGDAGGGVLLHAYLDWIRSNTFVPEPGSLALLALGALPLLARRRKTLA